MQTWTGRVNNALAFLILVLTFKTHAQETLLLTTDASRELRKGISVLLIPFENRMYRSDYDRNFCEESKQLPKTIKHQFRNGLNEQCYGVLQKSGYKVVDLMEDTALSKPTLFKIYSNTAFDFVNVPDPLHFKAPKTEAKSQTLVKGQLVVESQTNQRFMNARLLSVPMLQELKSKFKTELFVYFNQLDIISNAAVNAYQFSNSQQRVTVHYTVFNDTGLELHSGILTCELPTQTNAKLLIQTCFKSIATQLLERIDFVLFPKKSKK